MYVIPVSLCSRAPSSPWFGCVVRHGVFWQHRSRNGTEPGLGRGGELPSGCRLLGHCMQSAWQCHTAAEGRPLCAWALLPAVRRALSFLLSVLLLRGDGVDVIESCDSAVVPCRVASRVPTHSIRAVSKPRFLVPSFAFRIPPLIRGTPGELLAPLVRYV